MKRDDSRLIEVLATPAPGAAQHAGAQHGIHPAPPGSLEGRLMQRLLASLGDPPVRVALWNGETIFTNSGPAVATMRIASRAALLRLVVDPDLHFGECYSAGSIDVEGDLVRLIEAINRAPARTSGWAQLHRLIARLTRIRANTLSGARVNIHHHYDIGNEFYQLWLDPELVYTCAYFPTPQATLEQAQNAKMELVCRKLRLRSGESVVEAGCGWGALALHMATRHGVRVRAFNISREQLAHARHRARELGVERRVEFIDDDYRNISGHYDAFVSVGMLEHVGREHYDELGRLIDRCLKPDGRGLLHSISQDRPGTLNPWIEKRIFPGAYPPALSEMLAILEPRELSVLDVENLRLHYALTLEHWLERFERACARVHRMYDERFVRTWRLYLCGSLAAFNTGKLHLLQVLFARRTTNEVPWTRAHLYRP